jgi:hypothetical protein
MISIPSKRSYTARLEVRRIRHNWLRLRQSWIALQVDIRSTGFIRTPTYTIIISKTGQSKKDTGPRV